MATASASFSMLGWVGRKKTIPSRRNKIRTVMAQQQEVEQQQQTQNLPPPQQEANAGKQPPVSQPQQPMAKSKNMFRDYGGQWLSSVTRHVRIYAAYIDPVTNAFDQTQMDKLTLILDPTNEFVWTPEACNKVYAYFQELVDHYEVLFFFFASLQFRTCSLDVCKIPPYRVSKCWETNPDPVIFEAISTMNGVSTRETSSIQNGLPAVSNELQNSRKL